jgi:uncharacterized protein
MSKISKVLSSLLIISILIFLNISSGFCAPAIEGSWQGSLSIGGSQLRIVFNISKTPEGTLSGTLDSPDQNAKGIPINEVTFQNGHLVLNVKTVMGSFEGDYSADSTTIKGFWKQGGMSLPLDLKRLENLPDSTPVNIQTAPLIGGTDIAGFWGGSLNFQGLNLRIIFNIVRVSDNKLTVTISSPDQGNQEFPVDSVTFANSHLFLFSKLINGSFEGDLNNDKSQLTGQWMQNTLTIPLVLNRTDKMPVVSRPQEPKPPFPYTEREVEFRNEKAGVTLAGTLTLPQTGGPFPAVLLITGSGPEDRNETVFGHKPFLVLADFLTRKGIAVLRVDDRGTGKSTGDYAKATTLDFADDVIAGIRYLKSLKEINAKQIGLIGHSEGGIIAPMVAVQSPDIAFIVLMAGTALPGETIINMQARLILKASGATDEITKADLQLRQQMFDVLRQEPDSSKAVEKLRIVLDSALARAKTDNTLSTIISPGMIDGTIKQMMSPWLRYFLFYDPKPALTKLTCPVLAINGEKDMQVPPKENLAGIEEALKISGNKDYLVKGIPGLNHLFQTAQTGTPTEYAQIEETISPVALTIIGDWILKHVTLVKK